MKLLFYKVLFEVFSNIGSIIGCIVADVIALFSAYLIYNTENYGFPSGWYLWITLAIFGVTGTIGTANVIDDIFKPIKYSLDKWIRSIEQQELNK